ncbi:hypothetical protein [uncultured Hoeflea sp.]|uniref:hypothetical protein n=1 Tax=uncultured Hoeflea sp. TaxID=538666 RepID=UPI0030DCAF56
MAVQTLGGQAGEAEAIRVPLAGGRFFTGRAKPATGPECRAASAARRLRGAGAGTGLWRTWFAGYVPSPP